MDTDHNMSDASPSSTKFSISTPGAQRLPSHWLHHIFSFLTFQQCIPAARTCHHWYTECAAQPVREFSFCFSNETQMRLDAIHRSPFTRHVTRVCTYHDWRWGDREWKLNFDRFQSLCLLPYLQHMDCIGISPSKFQMQSVLAAQKLVARPFSRLVSLRLVIVLPQDTDVSTTVSLLCNSVPNVSSFSLNVLRKGSNEILPIDYSLLRCLPNLTRLELHGNWSLNLRTAGIRQLKLKSIVRDHNMDSTSSRMYSQLLFGLPEISAFLGQPSELQLEEINSDYYFNCVEAMTALEACRATLKVFKPSSCVPVQCLPKLIHFTSLTALHLFSNEMGEEEGTWLPSYWSDAMSTVARSGSLANLTYLSLDGFTFTFGDFEFLLLKACPHLNTLRLMQCVFPAFPNLTSASSLQHLQISGRPNSVSDYRALLAQLSTAMHLRTLVMSGFHFRFEYWETIVAREPVEHLRLAKKLGITIRYDDFEFSPNGSIRKLQ